MMIITMLLKTIPTARGAQSLQRMDSACLFLLFKLLGKVFRTMTITKGLWGKTMDQKFEIGTPLLMKNFFCPLFRLLNFLCASFFFYLLGWPSPFYLLLLDIKINNKNITYDNQNMVQVLIFCDYHLLLGPTISGHTKTVQVPF